MLDDLGSVDPGLYRCISAFDAVGEGDTAAYARAFRRAQREVQDPALQLALVDSLLEARARAYGK